MKPSFIQLIVALGVCAVSLIGYVAEYATIAHKSSVVANLENQIQTRTETGGRLASARATLAEIAGDEALVQNYFVPETGVVAFINDLEARAAAQGAVANVLSVATSKVGARPVLTFTVSLKGTFDAVMRTLGNIEYAPHDIFVSALSLSQDSQNDQNGKNSWLADLKLIVGSTPTSSMSVPSASSVTPNRSAPVVPLPVAPVLSASTSASLPVSVSSTSTIKKPL